MFAFLFISSCSKNLTVIAIDKNEIEQRFAAIKYQEKATSGKVTPLSETEFVPGSLVMFTVVRSDGIVLQVPAPNSVKSLSFRLSLFGEEPVALEISSQTRRQGIQAFLIRSREMPPIAPPTQPEEQGGLGGLLRRFWFIPLIFLVMQLFKGGSAPAAAAAAAPQQ
jgi:hypothetical protein